jgi:D-alanine-D-alanine ligase
MSKLKIGIIFGGRSGEHEVSIASAASIYKALDKNRYDVTLIAVDKDGRWLLVDPQPLLAANPMRSSLEGYSESVGILPYPSEKQLVPNWQAPAALPQLPHLDVVVPIMHGTYGEDGTIQGLLELAQIPYVGAGVLGSAVGMDKDVASRLLKEAGVLTVPTLCLRRFDYDKNPDALENQILQEFPLPLFVKPANAGSSVGVHKVKRKEDLRAALCDSFSYDLKILVQKAIDARELEVAVLGNDEPRASVVGEIAPTHEFYSYEAKYLDENGAELLIPAKDLSAAVIAEAQVTAIKVFKILECRGLARVDFFLDRGNGKLYLNEINTLPGFTNISMYPKLWGASGMAYGPLVDELIRLAIENFEQRKNLKTTFKSLSPSKK